MSITDKQLAQMCVNSYAGFSDAVKVEAGSECAYVIKWMDCVIVVIRGSDDPVDWWRNLKFIPEKRFCGWVHKGFYDGYQSLRSGLDLAISSVYIPGDQVVITGHSRGGAIAQIYGAGLNLAIPCRVVTFGSPKPGKSSFRKFCKGMDFTNYINGRDPVPRLPRAYMGWKHPGKVVKVGKGGFPWLWFGNPFDHLVEQYAQAV